MYRSAVLLTLGAFSSPAAAGWLKSDQEASWEPPRQTGIYGPEAGEQANIALGWSPVPTDAPQLAGAMDLKFAMGKRDLAPMTCGFGKAGSESNPVPQSVTVATNMPDGRSYELYLQRINLLTTWSQQTPSHAYPLSPLAVILTVGLDAVKLAGLASQ